MKLLLFVAALVLLARAGLRALERRRLLRAEDAEEGVTRPRPVARAVLAPAPDAPELRPAPRAEPAPAPAPPSRSPLGDLRRAVLAAEILDRPRWRT